MVQMSVLNKLYDRIWRDQANLTPYAGGNLRVDLTLRVITPGNRALDVGCGEGLLIDQLKDRFGEVVGVDISELALAAARQRGLTTYRVDFDSDPLPFPDNHFDAITCLAVIEHVFEPRVLAREIARVLAPGGAVYVAFPNMRYLLHIKQLLAGRFPKTSGDLEYAYDGGHLHYYTPADISDLFGQYGLVTTSQWGIVSDGIRHNWKYRILKTVLPAHLEREFLSIEVLIKAIKPDDAH